MKLNFTISHVDFVCKRKFQYGGGARRKVRRLPKWYEIHPLGTVNAGNLLYTVDV